MSAGPDTPDLAPLERITRAFLRTLEQAGLSLGALGARDRARAVLDTALAMGAREPFLPPPRIHHLGDLTGMMTVAEFKAQEAARPGDVVLLPSRAADLSALVSDVPAAPEEPST